MKNLCFILIALCLWKGVNGQTSLFPYHPFEIVNGQSQIIKRLHVTQATFNNTTRKIRGIEKKFYDNEGRDTLTLREGVITTRTIYNTLSLIKIQLHYDTKGNLSLTDTTPINYYLEQKNSEVYKYDEKGRLVWIFQTLDSSNLKGLKKSYPFVKIFSGTPQVDSIHFYYNTRDQIIKETFVVKPGQRHETATFSYNLKGLVKKIKYGDFTSLIKYIY